MVLDAFGLSLVDRCSVSSLIYCLKWFIREKISAVMIIITIDACLLLELFYKLPIEKAITLREIRRQQICVALLYKLYNSQVQLILYLYQGQQIYFMQTGFNPEQTANDIRSKSFLKSRDPQRETTGSIFFRDNKIRSCSYVKETENCLKAVPFYDKRDNTLYPTPSTFNRSWNANVHVKPTTVYAGMGTLKPLHAYDPSDARNSLGIPDFRPPYPNTSHIEIGSRSTRDVKHYVTNYGNSFITKGRDVPTNHPGIQAFRNKWVRSRLAK